MELEFIAFKCVGDLCVPLTASRGAFPLCEAAQSLLTVFEHCGGKVMHRVPRMSQDMSGRGICWECIALIT